MEKNNIRRHCPEVENLTGGKMPFVTRFGITIVALVLVLVVGLLFLSKGASHQLAIDIVEHTVRQISSKI